MSKTPLQQDVTTLEHHLARNANDRASIEQTLTQKRQQLKQIADEAERLVGMLEYNAMMRAALNEDLKTARSMQAAAVEAAKLAEQAAAKALTPG